MVLLASLLMTRHTMTHDPKFYDAAAQRAVQATLQQYKDKNLKEDELGICIARLDRTKSTLTQGGYRAEQFMYPASVVKLFYIVYLTNQIHEKKIEWNPEMLRAAKDMIVESNNDATGLIVDTVTGTTSGPSLPPKEMAQWSEKRRVVNRWYEKLGYKGINACQKTWNEGPYGREKESYGPKNENRNSLSPEVCVRLMSQIAFEQAIPYNKASDAVLATQVKGYLNRKPVADGGASDDQSKGFTGEVLPKGSELHSKAGWTSTVSHDVAWFKLPDGREYVWAIFTKNHSDIDGLVPFVAKTLLTELDADK